MSGSERDQRRQKQDSSSVLKDVFESKQGTVLLQHVQTLLGTTDSEALDAHLRGEEFAAPNDLPDTAIPANDRKPHVMTAEFTRLAKEDAAALKDAISTPTGSRTYFLLTNGTTWYSDNHAPHPRRVVHLVGMHVTAISLPRPEPGLPLDTEPPLSAIVRSDDGVAAAYHGDTQITLPVGVDPRQVVGYVWDVAQDGNTLVPATVVLGDDNNIYVATGDTPFTLSLSVSAVQQEEEWSERPDNWVPPSIKSIDEISSDGSQIFAACNNRLALFVWGGSIKPETVAHYGAMAAMEPKAVCAFDRDGDLYYHDYSRGTNGAAPTVQMLSGRYVLFSNKRLYYIEKADRELCAMNTDDALDHFVDDTGYVSHFSNAHADSFGIVIIYGRSNAVATVRATHAKDTLPGEHDVALTYFDEGGDSFSDVQKVWALYKSAILQDKSGNLFVLNMRDEDPWPFFEHETHEFQHAPHLENMGTRSGYMQQLLRDAVPDGNIEKQTKYGMPALVACMTSCCRMDDPIAQLAAFIQEDNSQDAVDTAARRAHPVLYLAAACSCESLLYDKGQRLPIGFGAGKPATLNIVLVALERAISTIEKKKRNAAPFWGTALATKLADEIPRTAIDRMLGTLLRAATLGAGAGVVDAMDVDLQLRLRFT